VANEIGNKIKILRKVRGLTQTQLADKLEVGRATISNYEIGRRSPHLKELERIASVLGVGLDYFGVAQSDITDLIARAKLLFNDANISPEEKEKAYKEIMKIYLDL
jgi:transcriptional regulator with XRE-family HTH domain